MRKSILHLTQCVHTELNHVLCPCGQEKWKSEIAQLCLSLCDPMVCSLPRSSVHGIFQAGVLEWGAIAFSVIHSQH